MTGRNPLCADGRHAPGCLGAVKVHPSPGRYGFCSCTPRAEPPPVRRALCPDCRAAYMAWLDAPMAPAPMRIHTVGDDARNVVDRRRLRAEDHYALVREQTRMIAEKCHRDHVAPPR